MRSATKAIISGLSPNKIKNYNNKKPENQSVHAVLTLGRRYILQLRDETPKIPASGQWSLFGGRINPGESPYEAVRREIYEELLLSPAAYTYLWFLDHYLFFTKSIVRSWFFSADVFDIWPNHKLQEGRAVRVFNFNQLLKVDLPEIMFYTLNRFQSQKNL